MDDYLAARLEENRIKEKQLQEQKFKELRPVILKNLKNSPTYPSALLQEYESKGLALA